MKMHDFDHADDVLNVSLGAFQKISNLSGQASVMFYLGELYQTLGNSDEAKVWYLKSKEIWNKTGSLKGKLADEKLSSI